MQNYFRQLSRFDWLIFVSALLLSLAGIAAIGGLGLAHDPPSYSGVIKQSVALALGVLLALAVGSANYRVLDHYARIFYLGSLLLLVAVLIFGATVNGTRGWFILNGWGFQPVEIAKLALIVLIARFMDKHSRVRDPGTLLASAVLTAAVTALVLLQPDFGSALLIISLWFALLLVAGVRRAHLLSILAAAGLIMLSSWLFLLHDYQKERVLTFFDPGRAPQSRGYNVIQARIAIGAGGLFGRGLGFGSQSQLRFVPEAQSDFIFAVLGEELGFAGLFLILALFSVFFLRAIKIARLGRDNFTLFLALGLILHIALSFAINVGMNLSLLPVTGITLPFVSAGGSSLVVSWISVGLLQSIAARSSLPERELLTDSLAGTTI